MKFHKDLCRSWKTKLNSLKQVSTSIYPSDLIEYTKLLELDPDPEYNGYYNWFLTGGNLTILTHHDQDFIIRPYGKELNYLGK